MTPQMLKDVRAMMRYIGARQPRNLITNGYVLNELLETDEYDSRLLYHVSPSGISIMEPPEQEVE